MLPLNWSWRRSHPSFQQHKSIDVGSDRHFVIRMIQIKLEKAAPGKAEHMCDTRKLADPAVKVQFMLQMNNRFEELHTLTNDRRTMAAFQRRACGCSQGYSGNEKV